MVARARHDEEGDEDLKLSEVGCKHIKVNILAGSHLYSVHDHK